MIGYGGAGLLCGEVGFFSCHSLCACSFSGLWLGVSVIIPQISSRRAPVERKWLVVFDSLHCLILRTSVCTGAEEKQQLVNS